MNANRLVGLSELLQRAPVEIDKRQEAPGVATDDREGQGEAVPRRPDDRLRAATNTDPRAQPAVLNRRVDPLIRQWAAGPPRPRHWLLLEKPDEQIELLFEQRVVFGEVVAEQRKGFRERAASQDHLRPAVRQGVEGRKSLKHP